MLLNVIARTSAQLTRVRAVGLGHRCGDLGAGRCLAAAAAAAHPLGHDALPECAGDALVREAEEQQRNGEQRNGQKDAEDLLVHGSLPVLAALVMTCVWVGGSVCVCLSGLDSSKIRFNYTRSLQRFDFANDAGDESRLPNIKRTPPCC